MTKYVAMEIVVEYSGDEEPIDMIHDAFCDNDINKPCPLISASSFTTDDVDKAFEYFEWTEDSDNDKKSRELLEEAFNAGVGWVAGTDNFHAWFEKRFG